MREEIFLCLSRSLLGSLIFSFIKKTFFTEMNGRGYQGNNQGRGSGRGGRGRGTPNYG